MMEAAGGTVTYFRLSPYGNIRFGNLLFHCDVSGHARRGYTVFVSATVLRAGFPDLPLFSPEPPSGDTEAPKRLVPLLPCPTGL